MRVEVGRIHLPAVCLNIRTDGRILMKYDMKILPLEAAPSSYFSISYQQ
jgi:hypothetical protein